MTIMSIRILLILLGFSVLFSCGEIDPDEEKDDDTDSTSAGTEASMQVTFTPAGTLAITTSSLRGQNLHSDSSNPEIGSAGRSDITSLKYYFLSIRICEKVEVTGSGYQNPENCLEVLNNWGGDYENFGAEQARNDTANYVDLMDAADVKEKLGKNTISLSARDAHVYRYGIINWMQPYKVTAKVPLSNGTTLYTKDGTVKEDPSRGHYQTSVSEITTGPASEAVVRQNNGGALFAFQKPYEITTEDLTSGKQFILDLVFNPDHLIQGRSDSGGGVIFDETLGYSIDVPLLAITPVIHLSDSDVHRESYLLRNYQQSPYNARLELYYLSNDQDKNILGALFAPHINEGSYEPAPGPTQIFSVTTHDDQSIDFNDWEKPFLKGFKRKTTVGDQGTVSVVCKAIMGPDACTNSEASDLPYELLSAGKADSQISVGLKIDASEAVSDVLRSKTWTRSCVTNGDKYFSYSIAFSGTTFTATITRFSESSCSTSGQLEVIKQTGVFLVGDPVDAPGVFKINFTTSTSNVTANASAVTSLNSLGVCSKTDWSETEFNTLGNDSCSLPWGVPGETVYYDIVRIKDNTIAFGSLSPFDSGSTTVESSRPSVLNSAALSGQ